MTSREAYEEIWARRRARGIETPPRIVVDPLDDEDPCTDGCHPDHLYRVVSGAALEGSLICRECGTVYRRDTP